MRHGRKSGAAREQEAADDAAREGWDLRWRLWASIAVATEGSSRVQAAMSASLVARAVTATGECKGAEGSSNDEGSEMGMTATGWARMRVMAVMVDLAERIGEGRWGLDNQ
ncbi:hypothetical protein M0R45_019274 [Rubus argutus]|uniref:Uncharacterized protein n=1 Tax=Rubus argutus TaxID=59490 RepID=A0AAW1X7P5_RUBAR